MQFNITPVKAKISDAQMSNIMNVQINQDNGLACAILYNIGYNAEPVNGQPPVFQATLAGNPFKILGDDYAAYSAADTSVASRFKFAADYVASKVPEIVLVAS